MAEETKKVSHQEPPLPPAPNLSRGPTEVTDLYLTEIGDAYSQYKIAKVERTIEK